MAVEEHIFSLVTEARQDKGASEALANAGYYAHALFFAHLVLEKLCKALWMKKHNSVEYPFTHNLSRLLKETEIFLTPEQIFFYTDMNLFQAKGRYPETIHTFENKITKEIYRKYFKQFEIEIEWLNSQLH